MQVPQETSVSRDYGRFSIKLSTLGSYKTNTENPCIYAKFMIYLAILYVVQSINCYGISQVDESINVCRLTGVITELVLLEMAHASLLTHSMIYPATDLRFVWLTECSIII